MITLKKNEDYTRVYEQHRSLADRYLVMYISKGETTDTRIGISVSKKVGNSVIRHRVKRLVKEAFRTRENMFNSGLDIVIVARKEAATFTYQDACKSLMNLARRHKILKNNPEIQE